MRRETTIGTVKKSMFDNRQVHTMVIKVTRYVAIGLMLLCISGSLAMTLYAIFFCELSSLFLIHYNKSCQLAYTSSVKFEMSCYIIFPRRATTMKDVSFKKVYLKELHYNKKIEGLDIDNVFLNSASSGLKSMSIVTKVLFGTFALFSVLSLMGIMYRTVNSAKYTSEKDAIVYFCVPIILTVTALMSVKVTLSYFLGQVDEDIHSFNTKSKPYDYLCVDFSSLPQVYLNIALFFLLTSLVMGTFIQDIWITTKRKY